MCVFQQQGLTSRSHMIRHNNAYSESCQPPKRRPYLDHRDGSPNPRPLGTPDVPSNGVKRPHNQTERVNFVNKQEQSMTIKFARKVSSKQLDTQPRFKSTTRPHSFFKLQQPWIHNLLTRKWKNFIATRRPSYVIRIYPKQSATSTGVKIGQPPRLV